MSLHSESMMHVKQESAVTKPDSGGRRLRIKLCGHHDECAKTREAWCATQTQLKWMSNQLLTIQENERKRIATDLHDGLGQSLTMIKFSLAETTRLLAVNSINESTESLQRLLQSVHGAIEEVRHVSMDLRPPMLDDLGILATLSWFCRELEAACPGMKVEKDFGIDESSVPDQLKITIFRIIQEATSNIAKHANADAIRMSLNKTGETIHLAIEDNGDGFDQASVSIRSGSDRGLGLLSMKERANLSGGDYEMTSVAGQGTRIRVSWQLDNAVDSLPYQPTSA